jgi:alkylation response protein AidB-like acyl-CoA dehydrogenase
MIDLLPDETQRTLAESFAEILAAEAPLSRLHGDPQGDRALIRQLATLGWLGLGLPEARGGLGCGATEEILLMREAGRRLIGPGLAATMLAAHIAEDGGPFVRGERFAAIAIPDGDGGHLLLDDAHADAIVAVSGGGVELVERHCVANRTETRAIDDSVALARAALQAGGDIRPAGRLTLWSAAVLTGMAEAARDMATGYAKLREQFGQPIGAFQAIKHRCADMALRCEAAWSQTVFAALALDAARDDADFQLAAARLVAGDAALANARGNVQIHGGIGFTEECDAQLLVRRTQLWLNIGGGTRMHQRALLAAPAPGTDA